MTRRGEGYHVGRVAAGTDEVADIEVIRDRAEALAFACTQVSGDQRVVIHDFAGSRHHIEFPCRQTP